MSFSGIVRFRMALLAGVGALALGAADPGLAQETLPAGQGAAEPGVIAYPAAFFADSRPNNAFDMLRRVPGFTFEGGENVRGFAGAAGNVLIDGQRPTSKSVRLEDLLSRIPASTVVRIELVRGGATGVDMQGYALVANVIRSTDTVSTTAVTLGSNFYKGPWRGAWIGPAAGLEWSRRGDRLSLEGAARVEFEVDDQSGDGDVRELDARGVLDQAGPYVTRERGVVMSANGSAELDLGADVFRLNAGVQRDTESVFERIALFNRTGRLSDYELVTGTEPNTELEIGGDYQHIFSERLSASLVALQTLVWNKAEETSQELRGVETFVGSERSGESILRAVVTAKPRESLSLEVGAEGAFNFLEAETAVTEDGRVIVVPNANVRVEERRGEAFAIAVWSPSDRLTVEAAARAEASRISQTGDTDLNRSFFFPKPRLLVSYAPDDLSQLRLRFEREVGQLDFGDFVATADLRAGQIDAGNADLEPERAWVFEAAYERRFWERGAVVLTYAHEEVQAVLDLIPIAGRFDAPGNIGDGTRDRLGVDLTLPLSPLGISGGLLSVEAERHWSKVTDPVTGRPRRISGEQRFTGEARFSQDLDRLRSTWGVEVQVGGHETQYRIDQLRRESGDAAWMAYWDWKPDETLSIRLELQNVTSKQTRLYRTFYDGPRSAAIVDDVEIRRSRFDPYVSFRVRKVL